MKRGIELRPEDSDSDAARSMIDAFIAWARATYPEYDPALSPSADPAELAPPGGLFLVAWDGSAPIGGAAFKRLEPESAEVKRLYVVPEARGLGVGATLMARLEEEARSRGYSRLRLDIGDRQPEAMGLYRRLGFVEIDDYNGNPFATRWLEKPI